jgi:hypothetical protein
MPSSVVQLVSTLSLNLDPLATSSGKHNQSHQVKRSSRNCIGLTFLVRSLSRDLAQDISRRNPTNLYCSRLINTPFGRANHESVSSVFRRVFLDRLEIFWELRPRIPYKHPRPRLLVASIDTAHLSSTSTTAEVEALAWSVIMRQCRMLEISARYGASKATHGRIPTPLLLRSLQVLCRLTAVSLVAQRLAQQVRLLLTSQNQRQQNDPI